MMRVSSWFMLLLVLLMPCQGYAARKEGGRQELAKKEKRLEDIKKRIKDEKKAVRHAAEKETAVLDELEKINKNLVIKRDELKAANGALASVRKEAAGAESRTARLDKDRKALDDRLRLRLKSMYKMRKGEAMNALFTAESTEDLGRKYKCLSIVMNSDSRLVDEYGLKLSSLEKERKRLSGLEREYADAKKAALTSKDETESVQRERTALLDSIKGEKEKRLRVLKELEQAEAELTALLERLRKEEKAPPEEAGKSGFAAMKGRLRRPVAGPVVSSYGKVRHPRFKTITFNNGIVIKADSGEQAMSVYDGKVIYVGWLKGYGQVLIMDHGGGYYTLFAHLSKVSREKGDMVRMGEEVGLVGDTGPSASAGLYFEIRHKGAPRDPMTWFAGDK